MLFSEFISAKTSSHARRHCADTFLVPENSFKLLSLPDIIPLFKEYTAIMATDVVLDTTMVLSFTLWEL